MTAQEKAIKFDMAMDKAKKSVESWRHNVGDKVTRTPHSPAPASAHVATCDRDGLMHTISPPLQTKEVFEEVGERVGETFHNIWGEAEELQHAFVSLFSKEGGLVRGMAADSQPPSLHLARPRIRTHTSAPTLTPPFASPRRRTAHVPTCTAHQAP